MKTKIKDGLQKPDKQDEEVLYELITNKRISISHIRNVCGILSEHKILSNLRIKYQVDIDPIEVKMRNKWGREITFNLYELKDRQAAIDTYKKMKATK